MLQRAKARRPIPPSTPIAARSESVLRLVLVIIAVASGTFGTLFLLETHPPLGKAVVDDRRGLRLAYPRNWYAATGDLPGEGPLLTLVVSELEVDNASLYPALVPHPAKGCQVGMTRMTWRDFEGVRRYLLRCTNAFSPFNREQLVPEIATYLGLRGGGEIEAEQLGIWGRDGFLIRGRTTDGWIEAVVAPGIDDLVVLHLFAPSVISSRRVNSQWRAMIRRSRLTQSAAPADLLPHWSSEPGGEFVIEPSP